MEDNSRSFMKFQQFTATHIQKQYLTCYRQTSDQIKLYLFGASNI